MQTTNQAPADLPTLGAAGCGEADNRCSFRQQTPDGFNCAKYRVELAPHHRGGQPWRAKVCTEAASAETWANVMAARR